MKKMYEKPNVVILEYNIENVIALSGTFQNEGFYSPNDLNVNWKDLFE